VTHRPADWVTIDFGGQSFNAGWPDGSYVYVVSPELVRVSTRGYALDVEELVAKLGRVEFEAANMRRIRWWENPRGPRYKAPDGKVGTDPLGFAAAFRGRGHGRAMSRRWIERGPWRLLREPDAETTFLQFHHEDADVETSLAQAKPCHALFSDRDQAPLPLRAAYLPGDISLGGIYDAGARKLIVTVAGRVPARRELRHAVATRFYQLLGPERPVDQVTYRFADEKELEQALPDLWLYGLEAELRDGSGVHRRDDTYAPPPAGKPAWVTGRDDRGA
jgi:hypothetical protein